MRKSLSKIAKKFSGRAKCSGCPFYPGRCTEETMWLCMHQFETGFVSGAAYQKSMLKKEKEASNG